MRRHRPKNNDNANALLGLLAERHARDVFVQECKNGPTWFGSHLRMDAWSMSRSWTKPRVCAYEIKVSRSDFLQDQKWPSYLAYCNEFYFVCPPKLIDPSEVGEQAGLLWSSKNATRLYTKKKAPWREVEIPDSLWRYILMSRSRIDEEYSIEDRAEDNREIWRHWLKQKKADKDLGRKVGRRLGKVISERITEVEIENHRLEKENRALAEAKEILNRLGVSANHWNLETGIKERLAQLESAVPPALKRSLEDAERLIGVALKAIDKAYEEVKVCPE